MSEYSWDPSRAFEHSKHPAATEMGRDICVSAGAGCGKTSLLVARAVNLVEREGVAIDRILAITFTEKAANQMKQRIREVFEEKGRWEQRRKVENAPISTIHGFCARLLRENALAAGIDPDFAVLDEHQADLILRSSLAEMLEEAFAGEVREEMFRLATALGGERHLRKALLSAYGKARSLGLPFSKLTILGADVGAQFIAPVGGGRDESSPYSDSPAGRSPGPASAEEGLLTLDSRLRDYHAWLAQRFLWLLERLDTRYQRRKDSLSALDFEDLQLRARGLLDQRALAQGYQRRFVQTLVDEFQDVNPLQDAIIERVARRGSLFIVGDVKQSIYRFRHADVDLFRRRMKEARDREDAWRMALQLNFRSRRGIIEFVNRVFSRAWQAETSPYEELYFGASFPDGSDGATVKVLLLPGRDQVSSVEQARPLEAAFLAQMISQTVKRGALRVHIPEQKSLRPLRYGDIFILFRSTSDIDLYEEALADAGVPYYSASSRGFFQRSEIQDTIAFLKAIDNPFDNLALAGVLRSPWVGVSDATLARAAQHAEGRPLLLGLGSAAEDTFLPREEREQLKAFRAYLSKVMEVRNRLSAGDLVRKIVREHSFEARVLAQFNGQRRLANLRKFCRLVDELEATALGLTDLLHHVEELSVAPVREGEAPLEIEGADVVTLMTWHAAKGLEKEMVILPDLARRLPTTLPRAFVDRGGCLGLNFASRASDGKTERAADLWPPLKDQHQAEKQAGREEEKRMLYVAITRAKEFLVLSGLRPEEMICCGVNLQDAVSDAPPGLVEVENIPPREAGSPNSN